MSVVLFAIDINNDRVIASLAGRNQEYRCPYCLERVTLKSGLIKRAHFSHKSDTKCEYAKNSKTEWHYNWQEIFGLDNAEIMLTSCGYKYIADIKIGDTIVEFQHSHISSIDIGMRSYFYKLDNKKLYWIFDCQKSWENKNIRKKRVRKKLNWVFEWERPHNEIREAYYNSHDVFLQLNENNFVRLTWLGERWSRSLREKVPTLHNFAGDLMSKEQVINYIIDNIDYNYEPTPDFERIGHNYHMVNEWMDMFKAGVL